MMQNGLGQGEVAIPEKVVIGRVAEQRAVIGGDDLQVVRLIGCHDGIEVFIDRCADHHTAVFGVVRLQVGTAAAEADTHGSPCNEHFLPRLS